MLSAPPAKTGPTLVPAVAPAIPAIFRGRLKGLYPLYRSFELWSDADGLRMSAAMSFYGILSLAPLLVLLVAGLGWWLDRDELVSNLTEQISGLVGARGAEVVQAALDSAQQPEQGIIASVLAFGLLLMGATGVFAELQSAFERLWTQGSGVSAKEAWWYTASLRLRGVAYVLALGFLMVVSLVISGLLSMVEHWGGERLGAQALLAVLNQVVSLLVILGLFVALMRMSAGPQPRMRHLVVGGAVGALLFGLGKYGLALYLSTAAVVSAYGAAGSLVVLLMWIYFASAVLLYAASCARVLAEQQGEFSKSAVPPSAAAVTEADSAQRTTDVMLAELAHKNSELAQLTEGMGSESPPARPPDSGVSPLTGLLAVALAAAGYAVTKRLGSAPAGASALKLKSGATQDIAPGRPENPTPSRARASGALRLGRGMVGAGASLLRATSATRHIPAKWAPWGVAAAGLLSKWRQKRSEHALGDALATLEADVRALRRLRRKRRG